MTATKATDAKATDAKATEDVAPSSPRRRRRTASPKRRTKKATKADRARVVEGMLAMAAQGCRVAAMSTGDEVWTADAETITAYASAVADGWAEAAGRSEAVARVLDTLAGGTPGVAGLLIASTWPMVAELRGNHARAKAQPEAPPDEPGNP